MNETKKRKVVLVGVGFVGMSMAFSLFNTGGIDELVLIDIDQNKATGEAMDLNHGLPYSQHYMEIKTGDYKDCQDADVVVISAGANQKPGQSRLELTKINAKIMVDITNNIMASGFDGIIVVASNPVDLMSYIVYKTSSLPSHKVIGTGTLLDSARLKYYLGEYLQISSKNIHAYILGEHGDSSFVPWMNCMVGCKSLLEYVVEKDYDMNYLQNVYQDVKMAANEIIEKKQATYYGIGLALNRLLQAIFNDENVVLCVSCLQNGEYQQKDLYIGVPAIINRQGIREIIRLELNDNDQNKFNKSANTLKENLNTYFL
ncbi:MAG: L-lactate dehydrogenase [Beduini sp.]